MSLLESLLVLGIPVQYYAKHVRFLTDKSSIYTGASLIRYDQATREKAELLGPTSFTYGDHELYHTYLGVEHLTHSQTSPSSKRKTKQGKQGNCWAYNSLKDCRREGCPFRHECRECLGSHSVSECPTRKN